MISYVQEQKRGGLQQYSSTGTRSNEVGEIHAGAVRGGFLSRSADSTARTEQDVD